MRAQPNCTLGEHLLIVIDDLSVAYMEFKVAWNFLSLID